DLALAAFVDHDRHTPGGHRFNGGHAEVLRELGPRFSIVAESRGMPEDPGALEQIADRSAIEIGSDDRGAVPAALSDALEERVVLRSRIQAANRGVRPC